ncbi:hypothetical protein [Planobispora rosea]|uniref:hypothetical protein n=1 Tax=Planobispora rosea TaxID=35762 RepID=UPI00114CCBEB|nr:hypothetical protein [Planobispora rosea]
MAEQGLDLGGIGTTAAPRLAVVFAARAAMTRRPLLIRGVFPALACGPRRRYPGSIRVGGCLDAILLANACQRAITSMTPYRSVVWPLRYVQIPFDE